MNGLNKDDIIRMAREAGMDYLQHISEESMQQVELFTALVAAAEREAIEQSVLNVAMQYAEPVWARNILKVIRARGKK